MKKKSFGKSVSLVLCTAMTVTMGGIPVLAESVDDVYEFAFTDGEEPAIPDYGIVNAEGAADHTKSNAGTEGVGDVESIPDSAKENQDKTQETDVFFGEESDWEISEFEGFASEDAVEVGELFDDGTPVTQAEKQDVIYLDPQYGNDGSSGESNIEAVKTLARARELVRDGGTIYLLSLLETSGSYVLENVTLCPGKSSMSRLLSVQSGAELTLKNVKVYNRTPDNSNCAFSGNPILVYGTLQIEENTEIGPFPGKSGIYAANGSTLNINGGKILGSGEESDRTADSCGIYGYGTNINMTGGLITGHIAKYGGGIAAYSSVVTLTGGSITGNSSGQGAGVYLSDSTLFMKRGENGESCQITGNTVKADHNQYMFGEGGGIFLNASTAEISAGTISGNKAIEEVTEEGIYGGRGGAIIALYSNVTIDGSVVLSDNTADNEGGAVFLEGKNTSRSAALIVKGGTISNNKAGVSGGGIFAWCCKGTQAGTKVIVSGGKITGNYTGSDMQEENAMILMGFYDSEFPDGNTGFANLYLSGSPEITGSVVLADDTDNDGNGRGPLIYADSSLSVKTPVLVVPIYGTIGASAVVYENEASAEAYKQQFCTEKNGNRGLVKEGNTLKWIKKMKVELLTFTSITPMKYTRKNVYIVPGEMVDPADIPETAVIPGYVKTGWRNQGTGRTPWDPASAITKDMRVQEVWALVKPTVIIMADKEKGCPSANILLTAQAKHELEDAAFTYQWYKDGEIIEGQTEAALTVSEAGEYKVVVVATSKAGMKASEETSIAIPAFGHSYTWQSDEKTHWQLCGVGGEKTAAEAHAFGDWAVTKAAAILVAGEKERTCKTCGYKEKEVIPAIPAPTATPIPTATPVPTATPTPITVKTDPYLTASAKKTSITLKWSKIAGADGYRIYGSKCGKSFKLVKTIKNGNTVKWTHKGLKAGTYYKYYVIGYKTVNGKPVTISRTANIHMPTKGKGLGYAKTLKLNKKKITIAKGKSAKIKATVTYTNDNLRKHVPALRYLSSDTKIATVNSKGVIKGKKKGTCTIYCYTQNGLCKKVKVKVK